VQQASEGNFGCFASYFSPGESNFLASCVLVSFLWVIVGFPSSQLINCLAHVINSSKQSRMQTPSAGAPPPHS